MERWPPSTYSGKSKDLYSNDEPVVILQALGTPDERLTEDDLTM